MGGLFTYLFFWLLMSLPESTLDRIPNILFPALTAGLAHYITLAVQGDALQRHFQLQGKRASYWAATGWAIVSIVVYLGSAFIYAQYLPP